MRHLKLYENFDAHKTAAVAIVVDNKVLILKRGTTAPWEPGKWNLPGGGTDPGESNEQAAIREAQEEANITPLNLESMFTHNSDEGWSVEHFVSQEYTGKIELSDESDDFAWIEEKDITNYEFVESVEDAIKEAFRLKIRS